MHGIPLGKTSFCSEVLMHTTDLSGSHDAQSTHHAKRHWEKLYRSAILESDQTKLAQRISDARSAILDRSLRLANQPAAGKEWDALTRALRMLSMLQQRELRS
jgi:hypothetical protein